MEGSAKDGWQLPLPLMTLVKIKGTEPFNQERKVKSAQFNIFFTILLPSNLKVEKDIRNRLAQFSHCMVELTSMSPATRVC